jgi:hypothetical protein
MSIKLIQSNSKKSPRSDGVTEAFLITPENLSRFVDCDSFRVINVG